LKQLKKEVRLKQIKAFLYGLAAGVVTGYLIH
jgi:hypothetical protein